MPNAVITGATHGIGKAIAQKFLSKGWNVAICARNQTELNALNKEWKLQFPDVNSYCFKADFSKKEEVKTFSDFVMKTFSDIDVLVNNAGIFVPGNITDEPENQLEYLMTVNVYSAYHLTRLLLPKMTANKSGHIFNMCSVASMKAYDNGGAYSITKYALLGFSENLRNELMAQNIKVTSFMPGATWSRSWIGSNQNENRLMKAEDLAEMVWTCTQLSHQANVESVVMRPLEGDI